MPQQNKMPRGHAKDPIAYSKKMSKLAKERGYGKWMVGKNPSKSTLLKKSVSAKRAGCGKWMKNFTGKNGNNWKGDLVGYQGIHGWLKEKFGRSDTCENPNCLGISKQYEWSLLKGKKYERKRNNFWKLCKKCHRKYDKIGTYKRK